VALDGIVFDLDGTLLDTNEAHAESWVRSFAKHGFRVPADRVRPEMGKGGDNLVPALLGEAAEASDGERLRATTREEYLRIAGERRFRVFDGVDELLAELSRRGLRLALATSSSDSDLDATFTSAGVDLRPRFDAVVSKSDVESSKPAPDVVLAAVRKLGLSPGQCAMVGDTPYDALSAKRAGVVTLGLLSGGMHDERQLRSAGARRVWRDPAHLLAELDAALELASPGPARREPALVERLMREALAVARDGMRAGEAPIGCVIATGDGTVIARGYNEMNRTQNKTAHAEIVAFAAAAGRVPVDARDLLLVSTLEPCVMCTGAAMEGAVDTIVYALRAPADAGSERVRPPESPESQMPRIVGGVLADESRALFEEWYAEHRDEPQAEYVGLLLAATGDDPSGAESGAVGVAA
jgi:HAD superfamily hydrolase (TIGR01509 family)